MKQDMITLPYEKKIQLINHLFDNIVPRQIFYFPQKNPKNWEQYRTSLFDQLRLNSNYDSNSRSRQEPIHVGPSGYKSSVLRSKIEHFSISNIGNQINAIPEKLVYGYNYAILYGASNGWFRINRDELKEANGRIINFKDGIACGPECKSAFIKELGLDFIVRSDEDDKRYND